MTALAQKIPVLTERDHRTLTALDSGAEPSQEPRSTDALAPHRTLAQAILFDAFLHRVACTRKGRSDTCRQCQRDIEWLASEDEKYIFGFVNICGLLKISTGQTRRRFFSEVAVWAGEEKLLRFYLHPRAKTLGAGNG